MAATKAHYEQLGRNAARVGHADHMSLTPGSWQHAAFERGYKLELAKTKGVATPEPGKRQETPVAALPVAFSGWPQGAAAHAEALYRDMQRERSAKRVQRLQRAFSRMIKRHGDPVPLSC